MKTEKFGLKQATLDQLNQVFKQNPKIEKVIIYGSRAKGNYRPGSDIDLTLVAPNLTLSDLMQIIDQVDDLLLPYKVDLSLLHQIDNPNLIEHIKRVGVRFE